MIDGLFVVNKPAGLTSHDVVARLRRTLKQKRIGHSGTLDPSATGVMLVAVGRATRLLKFSSEHPKSYRCDMVLGSTTSTLDADGEVTQTFDMSNVTHSQIVSAAQEFLGDIEQIPPMVSAVKIGGKRLHELARQGVEVERKPRPVTIYSIAITGDIASPAVEVSCSSGTYVRTLVADIATAVGGGAHLKNLVRTAIGPFDLAAATDLSDIETDWQTYLRPPAALVSHLDSISVDEAGERAVSHGKQLQHETSTNEPVRVLDAKGDLIAVYRSDESALIPDVVLRSDSSN